MPRSRAKGRDMASIRICPMKKAVSAMATMKCTERAVCRPPSHSVRKGQAASMPGAMAMPVQIIAGRPANSTSP